MADLRLPLELSERALDGIDHRPGQIEEILSRAPRKHDTRHGSAAVSKLGELPPKLFEADRLVTVQLLEPRLDGREGLAIGEDLRRLLQCLVLPDRDERGRRATVSSDEDM